MADRPAHALSRSSFARVGQRLERLVLLTGLFLMVLLGSLPTQAENNNGQGDGTGGGTPGPYFSDEAIGTLPTFWTEEEFVVFTGPLGQTMMNLQKGQVFEAYVPVNQAKALFVSASGQGYALIGPAGPGMLRVRIYGNVQIGLDPKLLAAPKVVTQLHFGLDYLFGSAQLHKNGIASAPFALQSTGGIVDLGLKSYAQGKIGAALTHCRAFAPNGKQSVARSMVKNGLVCIFQGQN
jgi:hypothetical protein